MVRIDYKEQGVVAEFAHRNFIAKKGRKSTACNGQESSVVWFISLKASNSKTAITVRR